MSQIEFRGIPVLRILNYHAAVEFYIEFLGFKIDWEHRFGSAEPVYMQISRNQLQLHLSENKRFQTGTIIFVETVGLEAFRSDLLEKAATYIVPKIIKTDWQTLQMEIEDPFGNLLRFNENIPE